MKPYPHHYAVEASAAAPGNVDLSAEARPALACAPPVGGASVLALESGVAHFRDLRWENPLGN